MFRFGLRLATMPLKLLKVPPSQFVNCGIGKRFLHEMPKSSSSFRYRGVIIATAGTISIVEIWKLWNNGNLGKKFDWEVSCKDAGYSGFKDRHLLNMSYDALLLLDEEELGHLVMTSMGELYKDPNRKMHTFLLTTPDILERKLINEMDATYNQGGKKLTEEKWNNVVIAGERIDNLTSRRVPAAYHWIPGTYDILQLYFNQQLDKYSYGLGRNMKVLVALDKFEINKKRGFVKRPVHLEGICNTNYNHKRIPSPSTSRAVFSSDKYEIEYTMMEVIKKTMERVQPYCPKPKLIVKPEKKDEDGSQSNVEGSDKSQHSKDNNDQNKKVGKEDEDKSKPFKKRFQHQQG